jgi:uncharacterized protein YfdQ (DUF2303 family)
LGAAAPGMAGRHMMGPGMTDSDTMMHEAMMNHDGSVGSQLESLRAELVITTEQEDEWSAYASVARADAQAMLDMRARMAEFMSVASPSAADWARIHSGMMRARADSLETLAAAVEALRVELDDSQKTTFDDHGGGMCGPW